MKRIIFNIKNIINKKVFNAIISFIRKSKNVNNNNILIASVFYNKD